MRRRTFLLGSAGAAAGSAAAALTGCTIEGNGPGGTGPGEEDGKGGVTGTVLAVKIDNVGPARPHTGLAEASVIHVEQVESGLSRLLAVYAAEDLPPVIGPVRSARETDLALLGQYGRPVLAYSGAQGKLQPLIADAELIARPPERSSGAYFRSADRPAPHNLYLRPARLKPAITARDLTPAGLRFGPPPPGGTPTAVRTVRFPSARFTFTWSAAKKRWQVAMDGAAGALAPATVVVQKTRVRDSRFHDRWGNSSPYTETVGSGTAVVLRDGRAYEAKWERPDARAETVYTSPDGERLSFARGQLWIAYVKR
ncbi:DUF3048 domain-containing protein [Streptomyces sp. NBC_01304]|uniref:DUF3048 domain-containing protein n=1 Tax=Streptomyces sp. NBC_01304 TaxID=2903818 RepID=UPI002E1131EC|nr:DUF3048 domain-containing protein [Streptomyces sp. NBC_01304]